MMFRRKKRSHHDVKTVQSQRNQLFFEEFPEGPYGASTNEDVLGKESPWRSSQHAAPQYTYEMRDFHEGIPRQAPGSHPTHDDPNQNEE